MTAVVLAAHGSHVSPETAGAVHRLADLLRQRGVADEVAPCFWKEPPSFSEVLGTLASTSAFVVPVFAARGFYAETVLPAEMGLGRSRTDGKNVTLCPPLADHPFIERRVRQRLSEGLAEFGVPAAEVAVALIGHGTAKHAGSGGKTEALAASLRAEGIVGEVAAAFLDHDPEIPTLFAATPQAKLLAIPVFVTCGSHVTIDVPRELGLPRGVRRAMVQGRDLLYLPPIADDLQLAEAVAELAWAGGLPRTPVPVAGPWSGFPRGGADDLVAEVARSGRLAFGELEITATTVRKRGDAGCPVSVAGPAELRRIVRGTAEDGANFRFMPTKRNLPNDWIATITHSFDAAAVLEVVYPGCLAAWSAERRGALAIVEPQAYFARQQGMFRQLTNLTDGDCPLATVKLCGECVRAPRWLGQKTRLPCSEPCNAWLSEAHRFACQ